MREGNFIRAVEYLSKSSRNLREIKVLRYDHVPHDVDQCGGHNNLNEKTAEFFEFFRIHVPVLYPLKAWLISNCR